VSGKMERNLIPTNLVDDIASVKHVAFHVVPVNVSGVVATRVIVIHRGERRI
jgi:hypothetical protein